MAKQAKDFLKELEAQPILSGLSEVEPQTKKNKKENGNITKTENVS